MNSSKRKQIHEDYLATYRAANGSDLPGKLLYVNGWWCFYDHGTLQRRYRTIDLELMTKSLQARAEVREAAAK